ncbi:hypothetical protein SAMN05421789_102151 [Kaistella chaponensis]|uniref:Outer membrane protein with beta-barrel domain n=1 Tax=Kaistella chaponensis TaxID=713588 RepID=A0A1N7JJK6_9FLAO|nr:DUF6048 family protein [Kaistella chaponensis]SIS49543.1 hypothetical protein SAMN05421789_102151 [Kaistella chaponensis]
MNPKLIFTFFFSVFFSFGFAQIKEQDTIQTQRKYEPNFMVGFDLLNAGIGVFSDRKLFQGFVSSRITKNIHGVADVGFEKNIYQKNGYDASVNGPFLKLGAFYMLANDRENEMNGFYAGGKVGGSFYQQEYKAVPVRGFGGSATSISFPGTSQSSYWIEGTVGGRVQLFQSPFYIDVTVQPKYLVFSTTQDEIQPMIVPGFGKSSAKFNMGFSWNIAYQF